MAELEKMLSKAVADWWPPKLHNVSALEWLKASPLWSFLSVMN